LNQATLLQGTLTFFAPCPRGLESLLVGELQALGASDAQTAPGGAAFRGDMALCWRVNLCSRIASRVLLQLVKAPYKTDKEVYDATFAIDWPALFEVAKSIRVDVNAIRSPVKSLDFVTLRIKDAVCDKFRAKVKSRPNVDTREPDMRIQGFLDATHFTLYIDTSGEPLFKRGYRSDVGEAPLKENLAAGIVMLTGWDRHAPLYDPMCGSGTLVIEAAMMALDMPPGALREFGFQKFLDHDAAQWQALRTEVMERASPPKPLEIFASDISGRELRRTRDNLAAAGLTNVVVTAEADVLEVPAPGKEGVLVTNPPYGVRIGESMDLPAFYPKLGDAFKARFAGWNCYVFSGDPQFAKLIRLKATKRTPLFNGPLECRLYEYRMVSGSARKNAPDGQDVAQKEEGA
jgi:putative N6-adenine-specific DNA methylase